MSEYIEREALLKNAQTYSMEFGEYIGEDVRDVDAILTDRVKEAPAADVAPVAHVWWTYRNNGNRVTRIGDFEEWYECSACGEDSDTDSPYCPNCGAKIDGGEKHE